VKDLQAAYVEDGAHIQIDWSAVGENLNYQLFRKSSTQPFEILLTTPLTSVQDFSITPGETYEYYVVALDAELELESDASNRIEVLVPALEGEEIEPGTDTENEPGTGIEPGTDGSLSGDEPITNPENNTGDGAEEGTGANSGNDSGNNPEVSPPGDGTLPDIDVPIVP
jgi:penicillin-binding protein 2A